jgi:hypothetical protein
MPLGSRFQRLDGYPFEVRYTDGASHAGARGSRRCRQRVRPLRRLFAPAQPDIALIVVGEADWTSRSPFGLPYISDNDDHIRPGVVVMSAGGGDFWSAIAQDLRDASPSGDAKLRMT